MKHTIFCIVLLLYSGISWADSVRKVDVNYRDAQSLAQQLRELFQTDIAVVVDANSLLIRGENADVQALIAMVQEMDKPQESVRVSLYRGVDPYGGDISEDQRRISTTFAHRNNQQDQWIMDSGSTMLVRDSVRVISQQEQLLLETDSVDQKALFKAQSSEQHIVVNAHAITVILLDSAQSARVSVKTQLANRADSGADQALINTEVESRRVIPTGEWTRLYYLQNQANTFSPENRRVATTELTFNNEQTLWVLIEPLSNQ